MEVNYYYMSFLIESNVPINGAKTKVPIKNLALNKYLIIFFSLNVICALLFTYFIKKIIIIREREREKWKENMEKCLDLVKIY